MSVYEDLQGRIGETTGVGEWHTVTQDAVNMFAEATEDRQWIHVDEDRAAAGPFGTTIAHGYMTLALIAGIGPSLDVPGVKMGINYGLDRVRFIAPVPVGSRIRVVAVLRDVQEIPGGVQVKSEMTIELDGSEKPACVAETIARLML